MGKAGSKLSSNLGASSPRREFVRVCFPIRGWKWGGNEGATAPHSGQATVRPGKMAGGVPLMAPLGPAPPTTFRVSALFRIGLCLPWGQELFQVSDKSL